MTSAVRHTGEEREESCFSRAARAIRRALSRICRDSSPSPPVLRSRPTRSRQPQLGSLQSEGSYVNMCLLNSGTAGALSKEQFEQFFHLQSDIYDEPCDGALSETDDEWVGCPLSEGNYDELGRPPSETYGVLLGGPLSKRDYEPRGGALSETYPVPLGRPPSKTYPVPLGHPPSKTYPVPLGHPPSETYDELLGGPLSKRDYEPRGGALSETDDEWTSSLPSETKHHQFGSSNIGYFDPGQYSDIEMSSALARKRTRRPIFPKLKKYKKYSFNASTTDSPAYMLDQPPPGALTERAMVTSLSSAAESDKTLEMELNATAGPPTFQLSTSGDSDSATPISSQFIIPAVAGPPCPRGIPTIIQDSTVCPEGSIPPDGFELCSVQSDGDPGACSDVLLEVDVPLKAVNYLVTNTLPGDPPRRDSRCPPRSHSMPSLSRTTSEESKTFRSTESLPDMLLKTTYEEFTPDMAADENDETYLFQCSCPGLYLCSVTGLVFHMEGGGDVVYRTVPWDRRLLDQHHKKPAGPLFDIKCVQQSVCWLHLPHCEISSTSGCDFLSVAHVTDDGVEFISPHKVTGSHVVINITGFSGFGNVKDEDSPPDPVRALVLLFYRPPDGPDPESLLNVLLLPRNVVLRDVLRFRKKLDGDERYIETSPHCKLHPKQEYTLSTCPEDDSVLVQPTEAEFDCDDYDNFFPSFQVNWETTLKHIKLILRDTNSSHSVWERRVCLSSTGVKRCRVASALNLPPNERLFGIRSSFVDGISGPVLKSLLDKLFEKGVMSDSERESADEMQSTRDKARFVIDTVRKKGEAASSEMIEFLCEADPFLCEHLELM